MQTQSGVWATPTEHLIRNMPDQPVLYLCPATLQATARRFQAGFDGLVTYAVKANPHPAVLDNLLAAGLRAFDVASPAEMAAVRAACADAVLHYNNPVRSRDEIAAGIAAGVASWSVDDPGELAKLAEVPRHCEIAVRFKLPVPGAAYDFGSKFGATPQDAAVLLRRVAEAGFVPALTFHPGTQCEDAAAWAAYIGAAAEIADKAGVRPARINVGGGFPVSRSAAGVDLEAMFDVIHAAAITHFGPDHPTLICEPGRAMVGDAFAIAARVKSLRSDGTVYLNDGVYGGLSDMRDTGLTTRLQCVAPDGCTRTGAKTPRTVFGPTCDSLDRVPDGLGLPGDLCEGDYVVFDGMGAYSLILSTGFNGYGLKDVVTVLSLSGH